LVHISATFTGKLFRKRRFEDGEEEIGTSGDEAGQHVLPPVSSEKVPNVGRSKSFLLVGDREKRIGDKLRKREGESRLSGGLSKAYIRRANRSSASAAGTYSCLEPCRPGRFVGGGGKKGETSSLESNHTRRRKPSSVEGGGKLSREVGVSLFFASGK